MAHKTQFLDADSFQGSPDKLTFRFIIMEQIRRILKLESQEFRGGETSETERGEIFRLPDTRQEFENSVKALYDALESYLDDQAVKEINALLDEDTKLRRTFQEETSPGSKKWVFQNDGHNKKFYDEERVHVIERKRLRILMSFLHRMNYLEGGSLEEVI